jgi:hypothetical protein
MLAARFWRFFFYFLELGKNLGKTNENIFGIQTSGISLTGDQRESSIYETEKMRGASPEAPR